MESTCSLVKVAAVTKAMEAPRDWQLAALGHRTSSEVQVLPVCCLTTRS